jgi:deoxyuridine 5'-triphosphate nucleotidohydrolase
MSLQIKKLVPEAILPIRSGAGYDLFTITECVVEPGRRLVVPLGYTIKFPDGLYGRISGRTGLAVKHGIDVLGGVVDPDYKDELKVVLHNTDTRPFVIHPGYRIAQLILERHETPDVCEYVYYKVTGI